MKSVSRLPPEIESLFELAQTNPAGFQEAATALIDKEIRALANGNPQLEARARAFQWSIETRLSKFKTPEARMDALRGMLQAQLAKQRQHLEALAQQLIKLKACVDSE